MLTEKQQNVLLDTLGKDYSGVYALIDNGEVVYIGESFCVPMRLHSHINEGVKTFDSFKILYTSNRRQMESLLIRLLSPKYNISQNDQIGTTKSKKVIIRDCIDFALSVVTKVGNQVPIPLKTWADNIFALKNCDMNKLACIVDQFKCHLGKNQFGVDVYDHRILMQFQNEIVYAMDSADDVFNQIEKTKVGDVTDDVLEYRETMREKHRRQKKYVYKKIAEEMKPNNTPEKPPNEPIESVTPPVSKNDNWKQFVKDADKFEKYLLERK